MCNRFGVMVLIACCLSSGIWADPIRQGPKPLRAGEHSVGSLISDAQFEDLKGNASSLSALAKQHRAIVIAMTSTSCPLSMKYVPTLAELANKYGHRDVHFLIVNSVAADEPSDMRADADRLGESATYVFDESGDLARAIGAVSTTDVLVIDSRRTVLFHGAVDDQYGFGYARAAPRKTYLADALDAILAGERIAIEATDAPGCALNIRKRRKPNNSVTYHNRIARLMNRHCVRCHHDGGVAPFALDTYEDVTSHAPMIREVVDRRIMPPWFAAEEHGRKASRWANDMSLTSVEKRDLIEWIESDQAEGDPADAPRKLTFDNNWSIGEPDEVFEFQNAVSVPATGVVPYQYVTIDNPLDEDKWVQEVEVMVGAPAVVHHVLVYVVGAEQRIRNPLNYWAVYGPGYGRRAYPPGYARKLPKDTRLIFQMHYTPNGTATQDKTKIGFKFAKGPPKYEVKTASVIDGRFEIPAGAKDHKIEATLDIPVDVEVLGLGPHAHLRGVAAKFELERPDGDTELLLDVPNYDFNWQLLYMFRERPIFPKGSTVRYTAWYDNSEDNPANPDPTVAVRWGEQSFDEMHLGYIEYAEPLDAAWHGKYPGLRNMKPKKFADLDTDNDGALNRAEFVNVAPDWAPVDKDALQFALFFRMMDTNGDGKLSESEFKASRGRSGPPF